MTDKSGYFRLKCADCHEAGTSIAPGSTGISGKDEAHISKIPTADGKTECSLCHDNYYNNPNHINGLYGGDNEIETIVGASGDLGGSPITFSFDDDTRGCDFVSCHGGTTTEISWYTDTSIAPTECSACYNSGANFSGMLPSSGEHTVHIAGVNIPMRLTRSMLLTGCLIVLNAI